MLAHRLRRWPNKEPTLAEGIVSLSRGSLSTGCYAHPFMLLRADTATAAEGNLFLWKRHVKLR